MDTMGGDEDSAQLSQTSVASIGSDAQREEAQAEPAEQEDAQAEPAELPAEPAERQPAQEVQEEKEFPLALFKEYCNNKQVNLKTRIVAGNQICKLNADKNGFNDYSNESVDIYFDETYKSTASLSQTAVRAATGPQRKTKGAREATSAGSTTTLQEIWWTISSERNRAKSLTSRY